MASTKKVSIFSFFAGAGFLDLGFDTTGYDVVYVNEYHAPFLDAYKYARKKLNIEEPKFGYYSGSITDFLQPLHAARLSELVQESKSSGSYVGFIGGPPCPDFSVGGKNRGRDGDNGKLSKSYVDLICSQKPDFFLFENVKGLWKTKRHKEFYEELKESLSGAGYFMDEKLINSIEYGVGQDRDRILLIGFHNRIFDAGTRPLYVSFPWLQHAPYTRQKVFSYQWTGITPFAENSMLPNPADIPLDLTVQYWFERNQVDTHPNAEHCFKPKAALPRFKSVAEGDDSKKSFKRLHRWRYSPTAAYGNNEVHLHPYKARRISVAEALAIQSLPSAFELPAKMTLSNMFKCVGNGVPYLVAKAIAQTIREVLETPNAYVNRFGYYQSNRKTTEEPIIQLH